MNSKLLADFLDRYAKGESTPEEIAIINRWYSQYNQEDDILDTFSDQNKELIKSRILNGILIEINEKETAHIKPFYSQLWFKWSVAALLIIFFKLGFNTITADNTYSTQTSQIKIFNNTGNILKEVMPDKSIIWLEPYASIKYPQQFGAKSREISMEGTCFFEITKNPERPFIIRSKHLVTKVWGTKFKVSDNDDFSSAEVTVLSGKVSVSVQGSDASKVGEKLAEGEIVLTHNQKILFEKSNKILNIDRNADISSMTLYKHVNLVFEEETLDNITVVLMEKFNANIIIKDNALGKKVMNADLTDLNLPEILEVLKTSLNLNYELKNNQILLKTNY